MNGHRVAVLTTIILLGFRNCALAQMRRTVAVTIDDLPATSSVSFRDTEEILKSIKRGLVEHKIPATGFVNGIKLDTSKNKEQGRELLRDWLEAGLKLGNHTYSHKSAHSVSMKAFKKDIVDGERIVRDLCKEFGTHYRLFRHPQLHTGRSLDDKRKIEEFLSKHGYRVAPVTIDNQEWVFAAAYQRAWKNADSVMMTTIVWAYLEHLEASFSYYEQLSQKVLGYEPPQILLLHANRLNAHHLRDIIRMIRSRNYRFCTVDEALGDSAYRLPDAYIDPQGPSWIQRWAIARKVEFGAEPREPQFVNEYLQ